MKGVPFANRRYTKGVGPGAFIRASPYKHLLSTPPPPPSLDNLGHQPTPVAKPSLVRPVLVRLWRAVYSNFGRAGRQKSVPTILTEDVAIL